MTLQEIGAYTHTRWLAYATLTCLGIGLLVISANIKVPMWPVHISLQTLAVFSLATIYGFKLGMATMLGYMLLGAVGFDVFSNTTAELNGLEYMQGATGGYLLGFVVAMWLISKYSTSTVQHINTILGSTAIIYLLGVFWLSFSIGMAPADALWKGMVVFLPGDVLKLAIVVGLGYVLKNKINGFKEKLHLK